MYMSRIACQNTCKKQFDEYYELRRKQTMTLIMNYRECQKIDARRTPFLTTIARLILKIYHPLYQPPYKLPYSDGQPKDRSGKSERYNPCAP